MTDFKVKAKANKAKLLRDISGSIMPMSAVAMIALAGMVGGGVDMSRAYMVQNKLQNACDSGVLAGRRAVQADGFNNAAKARANAFFGTNFDEANEGVSDTSFAATTPDEGNTVEGIATTTVDTVVVRLFGYEQVPLTVNCSASMSVGNSDVIMVLDVTGSMGGSISGGSSRIASLRSAMKSFYDTVDGAASGGNSRIRYGFVPYSSGVNVGNLILAQDASYLADTHTVQSREGIFEDTTVDTLAGYGDPYTVNDTGSNDSDYDYGSWVYFDGSYRKNRDCKNNIPADTNWTNSGGTTTSTVGPYINGSGQRVTETVTTQQQSRTEYTCTRVSRKNHWVIKRDVTRDYNETDSTIEDPVYATEPVSTFTGDFEYKPRSDFDFASYKNGGSVTTPRTEADGLDGSSSWNGCIEERATTPAATFNFNSILGVTPASALDLDIDSAPTSDDDTKWKPVWNQVAYYRWNNSGSYTTSNTNNGSLASSTCPKAAQLLDTMTESEFDTYADSLNAGGNTYHNIGMIWGARMASPQGIFQDNVNEAPANGGDVARHIIFMSDGEMQPYSLLMGAYGIERIDRRVTANGTSQHAERHTERFLTACEVAKSKGIRVWVIAFGTDLTTDLETCSSDDSAFTAASSAQLNEAFQEIAKDVGELRITQ
ncbi:MAG: Tad domain-containing protein [Marinomonas sp.]